MRAAHSPQIPWLYQQFKLTCLHPTTSSRTKMRAEWPWPFRPTNRATFQAGAPLQTRTMSPNQHFEVAIKASVRDAIQCLRTGNSQPQRNQPLFNRYYLWINAVYHLDLNLYDKWRTYSFKNGPIQVKAILLQLANYRFTTSYDDITN